MNAAGADLAPDGTKRAGEWRGRLGKAYQQCGGQSRLAGLLDELNEVLAA